MAAALFNQLADPAKAHAISAGTEPGDRVHREVVEAMSELGVDLSAGRPQKLTDELAQDATHVDHDGLRRSVPRGAWPRPR